MNASPALRRRSLFAANAVAGLKRPRGWPPRYSHSQPPALFARADLSTLGSSVDTDVAMIGLGNSEYKEGPGVTKSSSYRLHLFRGSNGTQYWFLRHCSLSIGILVRHVVQRSGVSNGDELSQILLDAIEGTRHERIECFGFLGSSSRE